MTFLEALQHLKKNECVGIFHPDWVQDSEPQVLELSEGDFLVWQSVGVPNPSYTPSQTLVSQLLSDDWKCVELRKVKCKHLWDDFLILRCVRCDARREQ